MKNISLLLLTSLLLHSACGNDNIKKNTSASGSQRPETPDTRPAVYLEGIYATSTATGNPVENIFDANPATHWQTIPGTGPDEGIMLYFQDALTISAVEILATEGSFSDHHPSAEKPIFIYTNGELANSGKPNERIGISQNGLVKSLYLRFASTGNEDKEMPREDTWLETYPEDAFIGISELRVLNDKGEILRLVPPRKVPGKVTASSTLAPEAAYSVANLFDSRKEFVWVEGAANAGEGETLQFEFSQPVNITAVQIWNGYQRSDEHFAANARVRDFLLSQADGKAFGYTLRDTKAGQKIELAAPLKGLSYKLVIQSIYPGKTYKDLAISDLVFYDGERPFVLQSALPQQNEKALLDKLANTPLRRLLNKRISNEIQEAASSDSRSLILRSDGTFVMYSEAHSDGDPTISTLADGNWEMLSGTQVKVFGKWVRLESGVEYYEGASKQNSRHIFKDVLNIDDSKVAGTKMMETFLLK